MTEPSDPFIKGMRLDQFLVESGYFPTRARARDAVLRKTVKVNGAIARKPSKGVAPDAVIAISDPAQKYVSRAALKLIAGLDHFDITVENRYALDIGASTGGFTQVLLERDAAHVVAIDVGHNQFVDLLDSDPRTTSLEGINARALTPEQIPELPYDLVVSDVSFISLRLALPPALSFIRPGGNCLLLIKPQFEVGKDNIGKDGLVRSAEIALQTVEALEGWLENQNGWQSMGIIPSPIDGGDGNKEYLLAGTKIE